MWSTGQQSVEAPHSPWAAAAPVIDQMYIRVVRLRLSQLGNRVDEGHGSLEVPCCETVRSKKAPIRADRRGRAAAGQTRKSHGSAVLLCALSSLERLEG